MKMDEATLERIWKAWESYRAEVEVSRLQPSAAKTYLLDSKNFVRWLADEFVPGGTL